MSNVATANAVKGPVAKQAMVTIIIDKCLRCPRLWIKHCDQLKDSVTDAIENETIDNRCPFLITHLE